MSEDTCEGCCVREEIAELREMLASLVEFTDVVKAGISQAANASGIQGMMIRQALPPGLLNALPKVG